MSFTICRTSHTAWLVSESSKIIADADLRDCLIAVTLLARK